MGQVTKPKLKMQCTNCGNYKEFDIITKSKFSSILGIFNKHVDLEVAIQCKVCTEIYTLYIGTNL